MVNQARKAMYLILKKTRIQKLTIDVQLDLFHNIVLPILLYSSEVWGIENNDLIIKLHVKFCKHILRLTDQFKQEWYSDINTLRKCCSYRLFKTDFA